ncbi:MAG: DUF1549 and DUF1553 domain-containing protein [Lentisphaerales bacterium]|nr:DUF1549 and DUF1553 domain-containing protein [Lentisphaerales bacterium]
MRFLQRIFIFLCLSLSVEAEMVSLSKMAQSIDQIISKKVSEIRQAPRKGIDDYTFARRIYLNAIGRIPTLNELEAFIKDRSPNKRAKLIEKLLGSKGHHSHMYTYWADLLRVKHIGDKLHFTGNLSEAIKSSIRENKPYDQFVKDIVAAKGDLYKPGNGFAGYKAREPMQLDRLANTIKTFTGIAVECAQCHDHPFDDWTQKQFYEMAAFTSEIKLRVDPPPALEKANYAQIRKKLKGESFDKWIVYRESLRMKYATIQGSGTGYMKLPHDYQYDDGKPHDLIQAKTIFGATPTMNLKNSPQQGQNQKKSKKKKKSSKKSLGASINAQEKLAEWMTSRQNSMFTKTTVKRLWIWVMGTEVIGPVANLELGDEGGHPELTNKLTEIMKAVNYDTRKFFTVLFNTKAYQSKALPLQEKKPEYLLDGPVVQRMSAQQVWDSMLTIRTGKPEQWVPTKFMYDAATHFYEKSQKWTAKDFEKYSRKCGHTRAKFTKAMHQEAQDINGKMGPRAEMRASEATDEVWGHNYGYLEVAGLYGASTRELIDGANTEPNIPQILYMMNGKPEDALIRAKTYLNKVLAKVKGRKKYELLWLATLNRPMNSMESRLTSRNSRDPDTFGNVMWALLNSNEFRFVR